MDRIGTPLHHGKLSFEILERLFNFAQLLGLLLNLFHLVGKLLFLGAKLYVLVPKIFYGRGNRLSQGALHLLYAPRILQHPGVILQITGSGLLIVSPGFFQVVKGLPERRNISKLLDGINFEKLLDDGNVILDILGGNRVRIRPDPRLDRKNLAKEGINADLFQPRFRDLGRKLALPVSRIPLLILQERKVVLFFVIGHVRSNFLFLAQACIEKVLQGLLNELDFFALGTLVKFFVFLLDHVRHVLGSQCAPCIGSNDETGPALASRLGNAVTIGRSDAHSNALLKKRPQKDGLVLRIVVQLVRDVNPQLLAVQTFGMSGDKALEVTFPLNALQIQNGGGGRKAERATGLEFVGFLLLVEHPEKGARQGKSDRQEPAVPNNQQEVGKTLDL